MASFLLEFAKHARFCGSSGAQGSYTRSMSSTSETALANEPNTGSTGSTGNGETIAVHPGRPRAIGQPIWEGEVLPANTSLARPGAPANYDESQEWSGIGLWFKWVLATTFGLALSGAASGAISSILGSYDDPRVQLTGYLGSVLVVLMQWWVLRGKLRPAYWWFIAGVIGVVLGGAIFQSADYVIKHPLGGWSSGVEGAVQLVVEGLVLALAQWVLLRRYARRASRWILANVLWMIIFTPIFLLMGSGDTSQTPVMGPVPSAIISAIVLAIYGVISSAITGAEMVWLLRHPRWKPGDPLPGDGPILIP